MSTRYLIVAVEDEVGLPCLVSGLGTDRVATQLMSDYSKAILS